MSSETVNPITSPARQWAALAVLVLPVLLISMDATILGFAVPALSESLEPTSSQLLWIIDIYSFVVASLLVTMGSLGDRIGRRRLLMVGAAGFSLSSLLAAFASSPEALIAARALLGVAGATLLPSTLSLIRNVFIEPARRQMAIAVWAAMFAVGSSFGPVVGGILLEHYWWGSVFLVGVPVTLALLVAAPALVPESRDPEPGPFDLASAGLSVLAMLPAVYAIKHVAEAGVSATAVVAAAIGIGAAIAFVRRQHRLEIPMIDLTLFRLPRFRAAITGNIVACFAFAGTMFFVTQYLQLVVGLTPLDAGLLLVPGALGAITMTLLAPSLARRSSAMVVSASGLAVGGIGLLLLSSVDADGPAWFAAVAVLVINGGFSPAMAVAVDAILAAVPPEKAGAGAAVSETAAEVGVALGTAVLGSILAARYRHDLGSVTGLPSDAVAEASETLGAAHHVAAQLGGAFGDQLRAVSDAAFLNGLQIACVAAALLAFAAAGFVARTVRRERARPAPAVDLEAAAVR